MVAIKKVCPFCGHVSVVEMDIDSYVKIKNGALISNVLWMVGPAERETLISGICKPCQDTVFSDYDDDEM
ncbi:MAG: hypothetical protein VZR09_10260 [Candidatus Gastranaerophilaceae bacterium]|nr:hypothetical protein [Candidatus Gastranaerophilaceae bacterium]